MKQWLAAIALVAGINLFSADLVIVGDGKVDGKISGGGVFAPAPEMQDAMAINWSKIESGEGIIIHPTVTDWSKCDTLQIKIYSAQAENHPIMLQILSEPADKSSKGNYYYIKINVNWQGWKTLDFPFKKLAVARKPVGFNKIDSIIFNSLGWDIKPKPGMKLNIAEFKLVETTAPTAAK